MTRHGMIQPSTAGIQPPATDPRAAIVISEANRAALGRAPDRKHRAGRNEAACPHPSWRFPTTVVQSLTPAEIRNPHSHRLVPRGFLPRGLSYACRRPKLFTQADRQLSDDKVLKRTCVSVETPMLRTTFAAIRDGRD